MAQLPELGSCLLVVFDGVCGLCNRTVRWLALHDRYDRLRFTPSTNPAIADLLASVGLAAPAAADSQIQRDGASLTGPDTILVFGSVSGSTTAQPLTRSAAVLACLAVLPQPWATLGAIGRIVPSFLRDAGYRGIARWRYRIWGRLEACPIPTPAERAHFL